MKTPATKDRRVKHGGASSRTYKVWQMMKDRCLNPNSTAFKNYGGRGIRVCERWLVSYANFLADMGEIPTGRSLERIDNGGNYELSNCCWATDDEQANNSRNVHRITWKGESLSIRQWAIRLGVRESIIRGRLHIGWSERDALETPFDNPMLARAKRREDLLLTVGNETKTTTEWSRQTGINRTTIRYRIAAGWSPDEILAAGVTHTSRRYRKNQ